MFVGYARVSTSEQETRLQLDALARAGVSTVFWEKASSVGVRPELRKALASLASGDTLVVWKTDRLARNLKDLLTLLEQLEKRGCKFRSLTEPIDTTSPLGEFMLQVLGAVAQLERAMIRERVLAGQVAAYKRGMRWGGKKPKLDEGQVAELKRLKGAGMTLVQLSAHFGVAKSTVSNYLNPRPVACRGPRLPVLRYLLNHSDGVAKRPDE